MNYFLLCAYNESKNIVKVIENIRKYFKYEYKIIIVNDGSTDDTEFQIKKQVRESEIVLLNHKRNLGLGAALRTGLLFILNNSMLKAKDTIITLDADNTHPIEIANVMVKKIFENNDLIIASRFTKGAIQLGVPLYRKLISLSARCILKIIFPYPGLKDYTSGYRAYRGSLILTAYNYYKKDIVKERNFVVQLEILVKLLKFRPKIYEVPINLKYFLKYGKSKLKIVKNIISYLNFIFSYIIKP